MGISLYGLTPATTYDALIKTGDNEPLTASLKVLSDGVGTNLPMEASTTGINFTGTLLQSGVAVPTAGQVAAKQDTLVSGTNIKTINSTSLLGSGNIAVVTSPSGVAGAIQFSNGSAFASDASNLFWDDTNNRLGIGTNAPSGTAHFKGSGSTSATTSLLVQNSAGVSSLQVTDDGEITNGVSSSNDLKFTISPVASKVLRLTRQGVNVDFSAGSAGNAGITVSGTTIPLNLTASSANLNLSNGGVRVGSSYATTNASAQLEVVSTTRGFLPPRMTTTEKNAIATPATGLVVYDSTTNKLCCYNGSTWNDLF